MALHHIEIYVSDITKSASFWAWLLCEKLGYEVFQKWPQGISFRFNESYLVFVQSDPKHIGAGFNRCRIGLNHLAFHAPSKEFIHSLARELVRKNIKMLYDSPIMDSDNYALFFEDPDRIKVEVVIGISILEQ